MIWAGLGVVGLVAIAWWLRRPLPSPSTPQPVEEALVVLVMDEPLVVRGAFVVESTPSLHRTTLTCPPQADLPEGLSMVVERSADRDTGTFTIGSQIGTVADDVDAITFDFERDTGTLEVSGLQVRVLFPLKGRFKRSRMILIGTDHAVGGTLREWFGTAPPPHAHIAWTLAGATRYAQTALQGHPHVQAVSSPEDGRLALVLNDHRDVRISLHNVFPEIRACLPSEGQQRLNEHLEKTLANLQISQEPTRDSLRLRIYPGPAPFTLVRPGAPPFVFASVPLTADLTAVFVHDTPTAMRPLTEAEVNALVPDPTERLTVARANVLRGLNEICIAGEDGLFMLTAGGDYENVLPLLPDVWEVVTPLLEGPPLVSIAARDLVFITGDTGPDSIRRLQDQVGKLDNLSYAISNGVYRVLDQGAAFERVD